MSTSRRIPSLKDTKSPHLAPLPPRCDWARRRWAVTPTEMAFTPRELTGAFERHGFQVVRAFPFDFTHPGIPAALVPLALRLEAGLERLPPTGTEPPFGGPSSEDAGKLP